METCTHPGDSWPCVWSALHTEKVGNSEGKPLKVELADEKVAFVDVLLVCLVKKKKSAVQMCRSPSLFLVKSYRVEHLSYRFTTEEQ